LSLGELPSQKNRQGRQAAIRRKMNHDEMNHDDTTGTTKTGKKEPPCGKILPFPCLFVLFVAILLQITEQLSAR